MELQNQVKSIFNQLPQKEQMLLIAELSSISKPSTKLHIDDRPSSCPNCGSDKIIKHSKYKDSQRYRCKSCNRTFSPSTGTLIHHIKKLDKFEKYVSIVENEGLLTIAQMSKRVGISIPTSFDWRHIILLSLPGTKENFSGEVHMDDLWFLYSQKGRKGLKYNRKRGGSSRKGDNNFQTKIIVASA